ncbi:hypothetical protein [Photobacterium leiognathi]|uniref:hypothetical protein n=1 Tax=Photobacterium leiognathi TaxID=553611 RepID=UPI002980A6D6|nr:hypothetical protein [Photobacterium leiognathi]
MFIFGAVCAIIYHFWYVVLGVAVFYYIRKNITLVTPRLISHKGRNNKVYSKVVYERGYSPASAKSFYMLWLLRVTKPVVWFKTMFGKTKKESNYEQTAKTKDEIDGYVSHIKVFTKSLFNRCEEAIKQDEMKRKDSDLPKAKKYRSGDFM